ncbi:WhiB family transcriptional regulator [Streptomyces alboviridis]|uniref:WhiB family transcriptional regulator n=1 Tax=Streptomyces alboviridis TaxID=67269 RepID=UPI00131A5823|nr:WhiB family transcriptional regulator [Streptomyces alboviridis]
MSLSLDAWHGDDRDGSEPQREREARQAAAVEVCVGCPVMVQCDAYASSVVVEDGKARLAEPAGIWGGRLALERHRAFIKRRHEVAVAAPVRQVKTPQRLRVLEALAVHVDAEAVAEAAGVDVRTANWQRSRLVTQLNLDKGSATRRELLAAAVERGLLDAGVVVGDDGLVPAVPPPSPASRMPSTAPAAGLDNTPEPSAVPVVLRGRVRRPGHVGRPVPVGPGQLFLLDDALAPVRNLFPSNEPMEAAA